MWFIALLILLPRTQNLSNLTVIRLLGRLPLIIRFLLVFALQTALLWMGTLCERPVV